MKRKWKEIQNVASTWVTPILPSRPPLGFGDEDLLDGKLNKEIPLLVSVVMVNVEVRIILIDRGSSADIIFIDLLKRLGVSEQDLTPYRGTDLSGFDGSRTRPLGYLELIVTFGEESMVRTMKSKILVLPCPSIYNCIIGRSTLGRLGAVASTVHLKMKFYSLCN